MNIALRASWTQERFLAWDGHNEGRHEFDGVRPLAMTGGCLRHAVIMRNLHRALDARLRGSPCRPPGPDAGLSTVGNAIRYPDALVTCTKFDSAARTTPGVVVVFEIVSPGSGRTDRIIKVREYAAVASIRRYAIIESTGIGLTVLHRATAEEPWFSTTLAEREDVLHLPEIGIEIPAGELYEDVEFDAPAEAG